MSLTDIKLKDTLRDTLPPLLTAIEKKSNDFNNHESRENVAKSSIKTLLKRLGEEKDIYFTRERADYEVFKINCINAIKDARVILQHHRGWKNFWLIFCVALITLGTVPLYLSIRSKYLTGQWTFRLVETDSTKKLNNIEETIRGLQFVQDCQ